MSEIITLVLAAITLIVVCLALRDVRSFQSAEKSNEEQIQMSMQALTTAVRNLEAAGQAGAAKLADISQRLANEPSDAEITALATEAQTVSDQLNATFGTAAPAAPAATS